MIEWWHNNITSQKMDKKKKENDKIIDRILSVIQIIRLTVAVHLETEIHLTGGENLEFYIAHLSCILPASAYWTEAKPSSKYDVDNLMSIAHTKFSVGLQLWTLSMTKHTFTSRNPSELRQTVRFLIIFPWWKLCHQNSFSILVGKHQSHCCHSVPAWSEEQKRKQRVKFKPLVTEGSRLSQAHLHQWATTN